RIPLVPARHPARLIVRCTTRACCGTRSTCSAGLRRRGTLDAIAPVLDRAEGLDQQRRALIQASDERKAARNSNAQEVARRKKAGESADELIAMGRSLGDEIAKLDADLREVESGLQGIVLEIPNITLPTVPE